MQSITTIAFIVTDLISRFGEVGGKTAAMMGGVHKNPPFLI